MSKTWELKSTWFGYLAGILFMLHSDHVKCCVEEERVALLQVKAYVISSYSKYGEIRWPENGANTNCCGWEMVGCNAFTGRVTHLRLSNMVDNIHLLMNPPWLFNLTLFRPFKELQFLDLSYNCINGFLQHHDSRNLKKLQELDLSNNKLDSSLQELFANITNLEKLQVVHLNNNYLHGPIQGICKLNNLHELRLENNFCDGVLPTCLQNLSSLQILDLSYNHFDGKLPKLLSSFTHLEYLDLSNNKFEGNFTLTSLSNLSKLDVLKLSRNNLQVQLGNSSWKPTFQLQTLGLRSCNLNKTLKTFPMFLSHQTNLSDLDLSDNNLFQSFPIWLFINNSKLVALYMSNNSLRGNLELPRSTNLSLHILDISNNNIHGMVPQNIGFVFSQLEYLNLSSNHFEGQIPSSIADMKGLRYLDLSSNNFSGELPTRLFSDCKSLQILQLSDNRIEGDVIPEDMNLPKLTWLKLSNNHFKGTFKESLLKSSQLHHLDISNNRVTGQLPQWIGNFSKLYSLSMSQNNVKGMIPTEICRISLIYLAQNSFSGTIPSCLNSCEFVYVHLQSNNLTGMLPDALSSCSYLQVLDLRNNQLSGEIPLWIDKLQNLTTLILAGNSLHGLLGRQLCRLGDINILDLSHNYFHGDVPICFGNMTFGVNMKINHSCYYCLDDATEFDFYTPEAVEFWHKNQLLSFQGRDLVLMSGLDLSYNKLTGDIPPQLGNLKQIISLNLSHNYFSGSIPIQFSNLAQVESLDLSYNNLSGTIPDELDEMNFLEIFNVSYNNLSGRVPYSRQFGNIEETNYLGNPYLLPYGRKARNGLDNPTKELPPNGEATEEDGRIDKVYFAWSFGMSCVIMLLVNAAIICANSQWLGAWFGFLDKHFLWWVPIP